MTIPALPGELYEAIFACLEPSSEPNDAVVALARCTQTSRFLRSTATLSHLWKRHYDARFTTCDPAREADRRARYGNDYYLLFGARAYIERRAQDLVDAVVGQETEEYLSWGNVIAYAVGLDGLPVFMRNAVAPWPDTGSMPASNPVPQSPPTTPDWLSRPYWAREAMGAITRLEAIQGWQRLSVEPNSMSLAQGLSLFSGFLNVPPSEVGFRHHLAMHVS